MAEKMFKINEAIEIGYQAPNAETGLAGVIAEIYLPNKAKDAENFPNVAMVEIGATGTYRGTFTPNAEGTWQLILHKADGDGQVVKTYSVGAYNVDSVGSAVATADGKVVTVTENVATLDGKVVTVDGKVDTATGKIDTVDGKVATVDGKVVAVAGQVTAVDGKVDTLDGKVVTASSKIDTVQSDMAKAADLATTDGKVVTVTGKVDAVKAAVDVITANVASLDTPPMAF
jgi:peptidoglycan hydrolase CwlO-like protein